MQKINIVAVGNLKEKYWQDAVKEYLKRLSRFADVQIVEVPEFSGASKASIEQIKNFECKELEKKLNGYVVCLDKSGKEQSSENFAEFLNDTFSKGAKSLTFVIGGSNGLTEDLLKKADYKLSFGKVTYPHQLMRVILLEQIYRAETILNNIAYHK